jgi:hypothetical protein
MGRAPERSKRLEQAMINACNRISRGKSCQMDSHDRAGTTTRRGMDTRDLKSEKIESFDEERGKKTQ